MSEQWNCFLNALPSSMQDYIKRHIEVEETFCQLNDLYHGKNQLAFVSQETGLEIHLFRDLYGSSLSIWYSQAEKNNERGDPTYTDHEFHVDSPFAFMGDVA